MSTVPHVRGLLLAAGAGRRMGGPKALVRRSPDEPTFVERGVEVLHAGGCRGVTVVVGAAAEEVAAIVDRLGHDVDVVRCPDWHEGMGASLRAGLGALARTAHEGDAGIDAVLVSLVDLPDLTPEVVARVLATTGGSDAGTGAATGAATDAGAAAGGRRSVLRRASYRGTPGHPALIGRDHWDRVIATATGDNGARDHFRTHAHELVECGDLATGRDVDTPAELDGRH
ncbi:nucleotidyltransferase family protein [Intrasporangium sp. YIM S08009]|uniref:nucleotidyltransferase family protein n=1 Tax=Intrasporangium zincisolvens TaxID=3080018 RepID=UPI002B0583A6|nr:nucleotidyltransferase family protein [Intrasporangium sp. YIM S08009]